ncbi:MAG: class I SAM-dependent methyltransferase [Flavobacteriaceae bacterium]|nr:class I SAM-dependent methyltransferase [Flavobacteriaceae bacterium]
MNDIIGTALLDYLEGNYSEDIITESDISEQDEMPLPYLFRSYDEMPEIEQKALLLCKGTTLDIGCGAGSHSLYLQNKKNIDVTAIDISKDAVEVAHRRGVLKTKETNIFDVQESYDTLLLLMNGIGLCGKTNQLDKFLSHLKDILNPDGQILLDSSDIAYMFTEEDDSFYISPGKYYGEVVFTISYKGNTSEAFHWLYLDYNTLELAAEVNGLYCEKVLDGEHHDYLAKLTHR